MSSNRHRPSRTGSASSRVILTMALAMTISLLGSVSAAEAQQPPPDLNMLLNLDLFGAPASEPNPDAASPDASMLDQIRTLDAMGYLSDGGTVPDPEFLAAPPTDSQAPTAPPPGQNEMPIE